MILEHGRPAGGSRLPRELRVYDFLDSLALSYDRVDHAAADNMEVCKEIDEVLDAQICKNSENGAETIVRYGSRIGTALHPAQR